jgi:hypothetical protein
MVYIFRIFTVKPDNDPKPVLVPVAVPAPSTQAVNGGEEQMTRYVFWATE